jgi:ABC-2 type transport system permease protein
MLRGIRAAMIDGAGFSQVAGTLLILVVFGVVMVPASLVVFSAAERWAKRTGRLKRQG